MIEPTGAASGPDATALDALPVVAGAGLTGLFAQISIHTSLTPVPFTLQTPAVLLTDAALGTARGVASMALYVAAGSLGVPWFANHSDDCAGNASFGYVLTSGCPLPPRRDRQGRRAGAAGRLAPDPPLTRAHRPRGKPSTVDGVLGNALPSLRHFRMCQTDKRPMGYRRNGCDR